MITKGRAPASLQSFAAVVGVLDISFMELFNREWHRYIYTHWTDGNLKLRISQSDKGKRQTE